MTHEEIHGDLYDKYNALLEKVGECVGAVKTSNDMNLQLIGLLKKVLAGSFVIILLLIAALILGALGERGFNAVMDRVPITTDAIAAHNDFDKWKGKSK